MQKKAMTEILKGLLRDTWPALAVLAVSVMIATFVTEFTFISGAKAPRVALFRFCYLSAVLMLPLLFLPGLSRVIGDISRRGRKRLVQIQGESDLHITPLKHWLLRPFQGIGLVMFMATKVLAVLHTGSAVGAAAIVPPMHFDPGRFLSVTSIAVLASALLSLLWTLDDLGIRIYDRRASEVRMIGKYLGLLLPIFFGFYGILSLIETHSQALAARYIAQMVVVLYPPFMVLALAHTWMIRRNETLFMERLRAAPLVVIVPGSSDASDDSPMEDLK
jgi:hypothetical protein